MPSPFRVVALVGSTSERSRTQSLAETIASSLGEKVSVEVETLRLRELVPDIGVAISRDTLGPSAARALQAIESAHLLIVASPVYKGAYPGMFKHLIDFIPPDALVGRPVLLAATGGSDRHALVVDSTLRPLFAFFRAHTVPSAVYASEQDFEDYAVRSLPLRDRIEEATSQAAALLHLSAQASAASVGQNVREAVAA
ncbi:MAG TPA: FMN reductase [Rhodocyclaceae bacterium]|nr:FMN reductase [Rhodocyclaceae bacterium]